MSIGNKIIGSVLCVVAFVVFSSCQEKTKKDNATIQIRQTVTIDNIGESLSGIWYHSRTPFMSDPIEDSFSWGTTRFDYSSALRIDLLGGKQVFAFADGGWDKIDIEISKKDPMLVYFHLSQTVNPNAKEEAQIRILGKDLIEVTLTGGVDTIYSGMVNGDFYRVVDPRGQ